MGIDKQSEIAANMQIGPTDMGMVRIYIEAEGVELPLDFDPYRNRCTDHRTVPIGHEPSGNCHSTIADPAVPSGRGSASREQPRPRPLRRVRSQP